MARQSITLTPPNDKWLEAQLTLPALSGRAE